MIKKSAILLLFGFGLNTLHAQPIAEGKYKFLGSAYSSLQVPYFERYWNQVTPENGGKWGSVESSRDQMNWYEAEAAYNFAKSYGFKFRYHVLVWGSQQPGWIEALPLNEKQEEIEEWFAAVAAKFPAIDYLEVVNEPLHQPPISGKGGYIDALGGSNGLYGTGWDWIIRAFELARQYFPDSTKLMINDYGIVSSVNETQQYLTIINLLKARGLIDGIGVQAHAFTTRGASTTTIQSNLDALAATGLYIQVCEMDVDGVDDQVQLEEYKRIFPTFWNHPAVNGITLWGWRHGLWRESEGAYLVDDRGAPRPSLEWMRSFVNAPPTPEVVSPSYESGVSRMPVLVWRSTASATSYQVQISTSTRFSPVVFDTTVADTTVQVQSPLAASLRHYWRVRALNNDGESEFSAMANFITEADASAVGEKSAQPTAFNLWQNYPNPFNPTTRISYTLPAATHVLLEVFDLSGKRVQTLVNTLQAAGHHSVSFDGDNLASGTYFYKMTTNGYTNVKSMLLVR